ncbi:unnamed protein product, partial [Candidula unifasciata]
VDPNRQWPNNKGISREQAEAMCRKAVQKSQIYARCQSVGNLVSIAMADCLGDILHGGLVAPLEAITSSFTTNCQLILAETGENLIVCPPECLQHGKCGQEGTCECQLGWAGETCQIDLARGPVIRAVTGGFLCYESHPTCQTFDFFKTNVDIRDKMKCRLQPVTRAGRKTGQAIMVDAINESATKFTCPLPKPEKSLQRYVVSATSDSVRYGNELPLHLYDTTCMQCVGRSCKIKNLTCLIKDVCYHNGDRNKENQEQVCDVKMNVSMLGMDTSDNSKMCQCSGRIQATTARCVNAPDGYKRQQQDVSMLETDTSDNSTM